MNLKLSIILVASFLLTSCSSVPRPDYFYDRSVMITNLESTSGGSGTVLTSSDSVSFVITNSHVCEVVKNGGLVHRENGKQATVVKYRQSKIHDLCLIEVDSNLEAFTQLAIKPPFDLEQTIVAGHPRLLPLIVNYGHTTNKQTIQVLTGARECTEAEKTDPNTLLFCMIIGKVPLIKSYESMVVSNLIQAGSSGSGVFNSAGELEALVFAGEGAMSYGFTVPYEFVANFLNNEVKILEVQLPDTTVKFSDSSSSRKEFKNEVVQICQQHSELKNNDICRVIVSEIDFR